MHLPERTGTPTERLVIDRTFVRESALRGGRLLVETVMVPSLLLYGGMMTVGKIWGLVAVLCWCAFTVGLRLRHSTHVPRTLLLVIGMLVGRTTIALALSSVYVFLLQPIAGSLFMAIIFLGSAAIGRPITMHLARDFIALPQALFHDEMARRMFTQVCILWGISRLIDAAMSVSFLQLGVGAGLLSRGLLSSMLTVTSVAVCAVWGWSRIRRMPNFTIATS